MIIWNCNSVNSQNHLNIEKFSLTIIWSMVVRYFPRGPYPHTSTYICTLVIMPPKNWKIFASVWHTVESCSTHAGMQWDFRDSLPQPKTDATWIWVFQVQRRPRQISHKLNQCKRSMPMRFEFYQEAIMLQPSSVFPYPNCSIGIMPVPDIPDECTVCHQSNACFSNAVYWHERHD